MSKTAIASGVLCGVFIVFVIVCAPSIIWITIGFQELNNPCNQDHSIGLALWLIINGFTFLFLSTVTLFIRRLLVCICCENPLCDCCISFILEILAFLFQFGWLIYGIILVSNDTTCHENDSKLYNTTLAAVILGFIFFFCHLCGTQVSITNNDDDEEIKLIQNIV